MSGYVHPTSVHRLDSWGGYPPHFQLTGMCETPREPQWEAQGIHSLHRGLIGIMYAAKAFVDRALVEKLYTFRGQFEQESGLIDWPDPDKQVRQLRQRGT